MQSNIQTNSQTSMQANRHTTATTRTTITQAGVIKASASAFLGRTSYYFMDVYDALSEPTLHECGAFNAEGVILVTIITTIITIITTILVIIRLLVLSLLLLLPVNITR